MATNPQDTTERRVSVTITIRVNSITQTDAQELEDRVRDAADEYTTDVQAVRSQPREQLRG